MNLMAESMKNKRDRNEFFFSGLVERFDRIQTRTGTPMISCVVLCGREKIRTVAFKDLAEQTTLERGERIECRGHIQSTEWTDKEGRQRTGWQVIAHEIRMAEDDQQQSPAPAPKAPAPGRISSPGRKDTGAEYQYTDGPF